MHFLVAAAAVVVVLEEDLGFSFSCSFAIHLGGTNISSVSVVEEEGRETLSSVCAAGLGFTLPLTLRFCLSFFLVLVLALALVVALVILALDVVLTLALLDVDSGVCRKGHCALVHPRRVWKYLQRGLVLFMLVLLVSF